MEIAPRITAKADTCGGKACIKGTRVRVADVLQMLAGGSSAEEILNDFPYLTAEDITAALSYAALQAERPVVFSVSEAAA